MLFKRKNLNLVALAQNQEDFDKQAEEFLASNGFPNTREYLTMYGAFIQHSPEDQDVYDQARLARMIRRAKASEFAYYLIHPDKRVKKETNEQVEVLPASTEVV